MPGTFSPHKEQIGAFLDRTLVRKIRKSAKNLGVPASVLINNTLRERFWTIRLSQEDLEDIARATLKAKEQRRRVVTSI
jgi:hypothetical protein